jgi:hypothetical protein
MKVKEFADYLLNNFDHNLDIKIPVYMGDFDYWDEDLFFDKETYLMPAQLEKDEKGNNFVGIR